MCWLLFDLSPLGFSAICLAIDGVACGASLDLKGKKSVTEVLQAPLQNLHI